MAEVTNHTIAGSFSSSQEVTLAQVRLPEFHRTHTLTTMKARIFEKPTADMTLFWDEIC